jgi:hypothetical protein
MLVPSVDRVYVGVFEVRERVLGWAVVGPCG